MKTGLDYFPFDIDFFEDEKIEFVSALYGPEAELMIIKLLTRVYRQGYFLEWDEDQALLFSKRVNISIENVNNIVAELLKREFFNKKIYSKYQVLTSRGIQKRFFDAAKRRKGLEVVKEYLLVNVNILPDDVNIISKNVDISKQSKEVEEGSKEVNNICPYEDILSLWSSILPEAVQPQKFDDSDRQLLKARWNTSEKTKNLEWWKEFFEYIRGSPFLMGQVDPSNGHRRFRLRMQWMLKRENFKKIIDKVYHR